MNKMTHTQNIDYYCLVMFPYPSGKGLHIGHVYNYALIDSYCRWLKYKKNLNVFQPFGYDAFGLPAENYARKIGKHPKEVTEINIGNFRKQMSSMNTMFDEKLITSDPSYQKWTQWLFLKLHEKGLAYKKWAPVNHCSACDTVVANEQVKDNKCERCGSEIKIKELNQWFFKITEYKERLINNLKDLDYPDSTKKQQLNWLNNLQDWCVSRQRTWGCPIPIKGEIDTLDTFVDSSFYYLRYLTDDKNSFLPKEDYKQVDLCVGGNEHACMHLIYARFINMFLYDQGLVFEEEPFKKVIHQGMITYDGCKMSKSKGNIINPDDFDSDELRMYLMFIGHYFDGGEWDSSKIKGIRRALGRWERWLNMETIGFDEIDIVELTDTIDGYNKAFKFNKIISTLMEFYNKNKNLNLTNNIKTELISIIKCFAPNFNKNDI